MFELVLSCSPTPNCFYLRRYIESVLENPFMTKLNRACTDEGENWRVNEYDMSISLGSGMQSDPACTDGGENWRVNVDDIIGKWNAFWRYVCCQVDHNNCKYE